MLQLRHTSTDIVPTVGQLLEVFETGLAGLAGVFVSFGFCWPLAQTHVALETIRRRFDSSPGTALRVKILLLSSILLVFPFDFRPV